MYRLLIHHTMRKTGKEGREAGHDTVKYSTSTPGAVMGNNRPEG